MQDIVPHSGTKTPGLLPSARGGRDSTVQSIVRATQILDILRDCHEISVTELSRKMGLHKSTTHRLLATLEGEGYVRQDRTTERYSLGMKVLGLAGSLLNQLDIRRYALPVMRLLMQDTQETVHLGVMVQEQVMCIESVVSPRTNTIASMAGKFTHAHVSSMGKVMLAASSPTEIEAFIARQGLPRLTKYTITTPDAFRQELTVIQECGFAVNREEEELGIRCAAAAVYDYTNAPIAAISVAAPTPRLEGATLDRICQQLRRRAREISLNLGAE